MSTLYYDFTQKNTAADTDALFSDDSFSAPELMQNVCAGQDAQYIIRKRAMILDLWNLQPEKPISVKEKNLFFDLPIIIDNSKEFSFSCMERAIPVQ